MAHVGDEFTLGAVGRFGVVGTQDEFFVEFCPFRQEPVQLCVHALPSVEIVSLLAVGAIREPRGEQRCDHGQRAQPEQDQDLCSRCLAQIVGGESDDDVKRVRSELAIDIDAFDSVELRLGDVGAFDRRSLQMLAEFLRDRSAADGAPCVGVTMDEGQIEGANRRGALCPEINGRQGVVEVRRRQCRKNHPAKTAVGCCDAAGEHNTPDPVDAVLDRSGGNQLRIAPVTGLDEVVAVADIDHCAGRCLAAEQQVSRAIGDADDAHVGQKALVFADVLRKVECSACLAPIQLMDVCNRLQRRIDLFEACGDFAVQQLGYVLGQEDRAFPVIVLVLFDRGAHQGENQRNDRHDGSNV